MDENQVSASLDIVEGWYLDLDRLDALQTNIARGPGGREVALAITKLQEAVMWLRTAAAGSLNPSA